MKHESPLGERGIERTILSLSLELAGMIAIARIIELYQRTEHSRANLPLHDRTHIISRIIC